MPNEQISIYYDGKCGLCSKEINYYKSIAPQNRFKWYDITIDAMPLKRAGIDPLIALKQLHAKDREGSWKVGVDAFLLIWNELKYWRLLALFIRLPGIYYLAKLAYRLFAVWRFRHLGYCQTSQKKD